MSSICFGVRYVKWRKKDKKYALTCWNLFIVHQSLANNLFELGYIRSTLNRETFVPICNVSLLLSYGLHFVTYEIHITIILYTDILLSKFKFQFSKTRRLWTLYKDLLSSTDVLFSRLSRRPSHAWGISFYTLYTTKLTS